MTTTIPAITLPITINDPTAPILSSDEATIDGNSLFCYDFSLTDTWAAGSTAVAGQAIGDVVPGAAAGSLQGTSLAYASASGVAGITPGNTTSYIRHGTLETDFDLNLINAPVLYMLWLNRKVATGSYNYIGGRVGQMAFQTGGGSSSDFGIGVSVNGNFVGGAYGPGDTSLITPVGATRLIGISAEPNVAAGQMRWRIFGADATGPAQMSTGLLSGATFNARTAGSFFGQPTGLSGSGQTLYRSVLKRLDLIAGTTALAEFQKEYAAHHAQYGI